MYLSFAHTKAGFRLEGFGAVEFRAQGCPGFGAGFRVAGLQRGLGFWVECEAHSLGDLKQRTSTQLMFRLLKVLA